MSRKVFTAGEVLAAADVNSFLMDQTVMSFAGTAARGSAIPSPVEGMTTYLEDSNTLSLYDGSDWKTSLATTGSILQVVSTPLLSAQSTTSSTLVDIPGFSVDITPKSASSKIMIFSSIAFHNATSSQDAFQLVRDSTSLMVSTSGGVNATWTGVSLQSGDSNLQYLCFNFLDSPATTSSTTYKVQFKRSAGTLFVNRTSGGTYGATSSITVMEVAA
jgi:hypothetical protein